MDVEKKAVAAFRPAGPDDVQTILALMRQYYAEEGYPFFGDEAQQAVKGLLDNPSLGQIWIAFEAQTPVGYVVLTLGYSLEYLGQDAFIDELFILPSYRGRGLGRQALALVEAECGRRGVRALHLEVERQKEAAQALYRRWGFVDHERYLMTRWLAPPAGKAGEKKGP